MTQALLEHLRGLGVTQLVIAGMMTHMCIDTTVPAAQVQAAFLTALHGTFAQVTTADEFCVGL